MQVIISKKLCDFLYKDFYINVKGETLKIKAGSGLCGFGVRDRYFTVYDVPEKKFTLNCFCFNKNSVITGWETKKGIQPTDEKGYWSREGRIEIKPGKFLNLIAEHFHCCTSTMHSKKDWWNAFIEQFTNELKGLHVPLDYKVSSSVSKKYGIVAASEAGDLLKKSCMRPDGGHTCSKFSGFYDGISRIVYEVNPKNELLYRALLWEVEVEGQPRTFLDRVYGTPAIESQMLKIASNNGWIYRKSQTTDRTVYDKGEIFRKEMRLKLNEASLKFLKEHGAPYVDTLCYFTGDSLSNLKGDTTLRNTSGTRAGTHRCSHCSRHISLGNEITHNGNIYCSTCHESLFVRCAHCRADIDTDSSEAVHIGRRWFCNDGHANRAGYYLCDSCGEWESSTNEIGSSNGENRTICDNCLSDSYTYCDECNTYHSNLDTSYVNVDGFMMDICHTCLSNYQKCEQCGDYFTILTATVLATDESLMLCESCIAALPVPEEIVASVEEAVQTIVKKVPKPRKKKTDD